MGNCLLDPDPDIRKEVHKKHAARTVQSEVDELNLLLILAAFPVLFFKTCFFCTLKAVATLKAFGESGAAIFGGLLRHFMLDLARV